MSARTRQSPRYTRAKTTTDDARRRRGVPAQSPDRDCGALHLDFEHRQRLMRLVIEQVRVTGWQVEVRLRIPLNDNPGDSPGSHPNKPEHRSPKQQSPRRNRTNSKVSSELRLRSVDHRLICTLSGAAAKVTRTLPNGQSACGPKLSVVKVFRTAQSLGESRMIDRSGIQREIVASSGASVRASINSTGRLNSRATR